MNRPDDDTRPDTPTNAPAGWQPWQPPPPPPGPGWTGTPTAWPGGPQQPQAQWPGQTPGYWQGPPQYVNSTLAIVGAVALLVMGVLLGLLGVALLAFAAGGEQLVEELDPTLDGFGGAIAAVIMVAAVVLILLTVLHFVSAVGVFAHKGWARWAAITTAIVGIVFGLLGLLGQVDAGLSAADLVVPLIWTAVYGFVVVAMALGSEHFSPRYPGR